MIWPWDRVSDLLGPSYLPPYTPMHARTQSHFSLIIDYLLRFNTAPSVVWAAVGTSVSAHVHPRFAVCVFCVCAYVWSCAVKSADVYALRRKVKGVKQNHTPASHFAAYEKNKEWMEKKAGNSGSARQLVCVNLFQEWCEHFLLKATNHVCVFICQANTAENRTWKQNFGVIQTFQWYLRIQIEQSPPKKKFPTYFGEGNLGFMSHFLHSFVWPLEKSSVNGYDTAAFPLSIKLQM